jgi:hypothetical protein
MPALGLTTRRETRPEDEDRLKKGKILALSPLAEIGIQPRYSHRSENEDARTGAPGDKANGRRENWS